MSSAGVRRLRDTSSRVADSILDEDRIQIESEKIIKETGVINDNVPGISNASSGAGHYLNKTGDLKDGIFGNNFAIVDILDDTFKISIAGNTYESVLILNGEGGADDDLISIELGDTTSLLHAEIIVQAGADSITIKQELLENN